MKKLLKKQRNVLVLMLIGLIPFIYSCGGGGGGGGTTQTTTKQEASLTAQNSQKAGGAVVQTINFGGSSATTSSSGKPGDKGVSDVLSNSPLIDTIESVISILKGENSEKGLYTLENGNRYGSSGPTTENCSYGGTLTISATWTGPDTDPVDLNANATFS